MSIDLMKENGFTLKKTRSRGYPAETITLNHIAFLANTPTKAEFHSPYVEQASVDIILHVNENNTWAISTLNRVRLKLADWFRFPGSSVSSTENDVYMCLQRRGQLLMILIIWKSGLSDKIKLDFFQAVGDVFVV